MNNAASPIQQKIFRLTLALVIAFFFIATTTVVASAATTNALPIAVEVYFEDPALIVGSIGIFLLFIASLFLIVQQSPLRTRYSAQHESKC